MILEFKIENIDKNDYNYSIEYQHENEFKILLFPTVSFSEKH